MHKITSALHFIKILNSRPLQSTTIYKLRANRYQKLIRDTLNLQNGIHTAFHENFLPGTTILDFQANQYQNQTLLY